MYRLPLGISIDICRPLGFRDGAYHYGIHPDFHRNVDEMIRLGFDTIDVNLLNAYVPQDLNLYDDGFDYLKNCGLKINAIHMPFRQEWADLACPYEEDRKEIVKMFTGFFRKFDVYSPSAYVFHPGGYDATPQNFDYRMTALCNSAAALCDGTSNRVCIENMTDDPLFDTSEKVLELLRRVPAVFTCVDTNHFLHEKAVDAIPKYGKRIGAVHISDYDYVQERHILPKEGKIDWNALIGALEKADFHGTFNYELMPDKYTLKQILDNYVSLFDEYNKRI